LQGVLNKVMARRQFKDLDLNFQPHPVTGDVPFSLDEESIKKSMKRLLFIEQYEKPFHPEIFAGMNRLLFEPMTPAVASALGGQIKFVLDRYEPRITTLKVSVMPFYEKNRFDVTIDFRIVNQPTITRVGLMLERIR
jgi:phage baseplate assembly protein W